MPDDNNPQTFRQLLFTDLGEEIRSRREPEHLYTAAAIGAFGAVTWGIATIATVSPSKPVSFFWHPAFVAIVACVVLSGVVISKIVREHRNYTVLRREQISIAQSLAKSCGFEINNLPKRLQPGSEDGIGYMWSIVVVVGAAIGAILFCFSILFFKYDLVQR